MFAVIKYPADRRAGVRRNLYEIELPVGRGLEGILYLQGPQLLAFRINDENLSGPDQFVYLGSGLPWDPAMKTCDKCHPLKDEKSGNFPLQ